MSKVNRKKERQIILLFLFLPILLLVLFGILPMIEIINYSFTNWDGIAISKEYIGLDNYIKVLTTPEYINAFKNNLYYFLSGILQIIIGLILAIILSFKVKGKNFFKGTFIFPILISGVAVSMIFRLFFEPKGTFDFILTLLGFEENIRYWLGDPDIVNITLAFISLWRHTGTSFIIYFGAIQSIPIEYYKISEIEGANILQKVREVIIPNISTVLKINTSLLIIGAISAFEIPLIITNGSNGTSTFLLQTMKTAFENRMYGLASSMAVILTIVIIIIVYIQKKVSGNNEEY